jgi:hypothetical protein
MATIQYGVFTPDTYAALVGEFGNQGNISENTIYLDTANGSNANDGSSWSSALATMAEAVSRVQENGRILFTGVVKEHVTGPLGKNNVTIEGLQYVPRQATTSGVANGAGATWLSATGGTTALLTVRSQGWTVANIYFNNSATAAPDIDLVTVGDPPAEADAAHFLAYNCIFTGSDNGLDATDGTNFVRLVNCTFFGFSGSGDIAINATGGVGTLLDWRIEGCKFFNNAANITAALSHGTIASCQFENGSASNINLTNGTAPNFVVGNAFSIAAADFDPAGGTTGVTGDVWSNTLTDAIETGLPAN